MSTQRSVHVHSTSPQSARQRAGPTCAHTPPTHRKKEKQREKGRPICYSSQKLPLQPWLPPSLDKGCFLWLKQKRKKTRAHLLPERQEGMRHVSPLPQAVAQRRAHGDPVPGGLHSSLLTLHSREQSVSWRHTGQELPRQQGPPASVQKEVSAIQFSGCWFLCPKPGSPKWQVGTSEGPQVGGAALSPRLTKARAPPVSNSAALMQPKKRNHSPSLESWTSPVPALASLNRGVKTTPKPAS